MTKEVQIDYTGLQKTVEALLPGDFPYTFEELVNRMISGETGGIREIVKETGKWLFSTVTFPIEHGIKLLFLILFSALFSNFSKAFSSLFIFIKSFSNSSNFLLI